MCSFKIIFNFDIHDPSVNRSCNYSRTHKPDDLNTQRSEPCNSENNIRGSSSDIFTSDFLGLRVGRLLFSIWNRIVFYRKH